MDNPYSLLKELFPVCRSLTGEGNRATFKILQRELEGLNIHSIPSGEKCFDWTVPEEWNIYEGFLEDEQGFRILDFAKNNLHIVGYSTPVDIILTLEELQEHLYSLENLPQAIPYVTSYYKERWGFCLSDKERKALKKGKYHAVIKSCLKPGILNYADLIIPGKSSKEIMFSTYICHPSLANDNLSGPCVLAFLGKWLQSLPDLKYTYRLIFIPETIGAIVYLYKNLQVLKENVIAGFNLTCVGDEKNWSFLPSRNGNSLSDRVAEYVLKNYTPSYISYSFLDRGSDERQYCSPGVDLPVVSIMRSKYNTYPEYHTSLDNPDFVTPKGMTQSLDIHKKCINIIEKNEVCKGTCLCEPQLGKRGLYPTISSKQTMGSAKSIMNFLMYADGSNNLLDISEKIDLSFDICEAVSKVLLKAGLIEISEEF